MYEGMYELFKQDFLSFFESNFRFHVYCSYKDELPFVISIFFLHAQAVV